MRVDVAILGAGPVGCVLALALAEAGRTVALFATRTPGESGTKAFRPIALSHASRLILERVGAWEGLPATPIETIHVSQAGRFGRALLCAAECDVPALGYVVAYDALMAALAERSVARVASFRAGDAPSPDELASAACVVHAEGSSTDMREKRYEQDALVAEIEATPAAGARAWERFTPQGPLALLPLAGRLAAVWAVRPDQADALEAAPDADFLQALQAAFGRRAGRFTSVHRRSRVPLALRQRRDRVEGRQVFVGNAAQALHPVAGQGLNLGLRDAWHLARCIATQPDAGDPAALARYAAIRRLDASATTRVTDMLASIYVGDNALAAAARGAAMLALDACAPARRFFARRMVYGPSAIP